MIIERPGLLACAVALLVAFTVFLVPIRIEVSTARGAAVRFPELTSGIVADHFLGLLKRKVGICVIMAWFALAACRNWRNPVGMVEWSGLFVGIGWIAAWLAHLAFG